MNREFQLEWIESGSDKGRLAIYSGDQLIGLVAEASYQRIKDGGDKYEGAHPHPGDDRSVPDSGFELERLRRKKIAEGVAEDDERPRLTPQELSKLANFHAGFLDSLSPELAARVVNHMAMTDTTNPVEALREVTKEPAMAALWNEHRSKHMTAYKE